MKKSLISLLLVLLICMSLSVFAEADSPEAVFTLETTSAKYYHGYMGSTYTIEGQDVTICDGANERTNETGYLYFKAAKYSKTGEYATPVALRVSVFLKEHEEETRQTLPEVKTIPGECAVVVLHVDLDRLAAVYGKGKQVFSSSENGYHSFCYEVYDSDGNLVTEASHTVAIEGAYQVEKPADPTETPEVFSFTDSYGRLSGQWLYAGGAPYAYRCYFTLVTGPNGGSYTMTFPCSETEADTVSFSAGANSVYKLTYTYPLSSSNDGFSYSGSIPWEGPNQTSGSFRLSISGGQVSAGEFAAEKISGPEPTADVIVSAQVQRSGDKYQVEVELVPQVQETFVICAVYDTDGKMMSLAAKKVPAEMNSITLTPDAGENDHSLKVFVLNTGGVPLDENLEKDLQALAR